MSGLHLEDRVKAHGWFGRRLAEYYRWYPKRIDPPKVDQLMMSPRSIEGVYVHVPFCDELCVFCPFNKRRSHDVDLASYVAAMRSEIDQYSAFCTSNGLKFIYLGGGTPSVLPPGAVEELLVALSERFAIADDCEISVEVHPSHATKDYLNSLRRIGVTRVSSGIQSLDDQLLGRIGATHTGVQSVAALEAISETFSAWGLDLLYRCPGQSVREWEESLEKTIRTWNPPHVSCYTIYLPDPSEQPTREEDVEMAVIANELLSSSGHEHYASCATGGFDHALPGHRCQYEVRHWGAPQASYLGIGAGAIGFVGDTVTVNVHDPAKYARLAATLLPIIATTAVTSTELQHRYFVLGVKAIEVPLDPFQSTFGTSPHVVFKGQFQDLIDADLATLDHEKKMLRLTDVGRFFVDQVSECFWSQAEMGIPHPETDSLRRLEMTHRN